MLFVRTRVLVPVQTFTSSTPPVILPLPSAVNVPMRPKKLPVRPQASVPLMEKAYCPIRLAFEKFPTGGGGGGGCVEPLPPQAASKAAARSAKQKIKRFTEHLPAEISGLLRVAHVLRQAKAARR